MSSTAQRCNWKTSERKGAHKSRRFRSIFLPFYYQKINPGWWDLKSWPPLTYYISLCLPWREGGEGRRLLSRERIMLRPGAEEISGKKNQTSQQHSRWFSALYPWHRAVCILDVKAGLREGGVCFYVKTLSCCPTQYRKQSLLLLENRCGNECYNKLQWTFWGHQDLNKTLLKLGNHSIFHKVNMTPPPVTGMALPTAIMDP